MVSMVTAILLPFTVIPSSSLSVKQDTLTFSVSSLSLALDLRFLKLQKVVQRLRSFIFPLPLFRERERESERARESLVRNREI